MSTAKLKVAIVGAGGWGYQHARVLSERNDVELAGVWSRKRSSADARAAEFGTRGYNDIDEMLSRERPDLVTVCLPNQQHFDATLRVIRAGRPLLVEKPLVFDLAEADTLLAEARQRGLFFAINFNHRYARPIRMAKEALDAGRLGDLVFATWRFGGEGEAEHPFNNLIETQCHGLDALEHLCGPIATISAEMTDKTRPGAFTTLVLALRFASGAVGSLVGSYDASYAHPGTHAMELCGTRGRVLIEDTVARYSFHAHGSETGEVWQAGYFNDRDREFHRTFDAHLDAVLNSLRVGQPPPIPATAGHRALVLAHAAIESFRAGRRVSVGG
jgi:predicted dehydrogenase